MTSSRALALVFAGMGATAASVGPLLPVLAARLDTSPAVVSLATSFLFSGLLAGVVAAVVASRRVAAGPVLAVGAAVQAVALVALALAPTTVAVHLAALVLGAGFGANEVTASVLAGRGPGGSSRLAMLTAVFAAAAILTPVVVATSVGAMGHVVFGAVLVACVHAGGVAAVRRIPSWSRPEEAPDASTTAPTTTGNRRAVVATTVVLVAYVGAEATLATWSGELARELLDLTPGEAALAPTAFWVCLLLGRVVATRLLRRHAPRGVLLATLAVGALAALLAAAVAPVAGLLAVVLLAVTGAAMGPVYGVTLSFGAQPTGGPPMVRTGMLVGVGAVGGAAVPAAIAAVAAAGPAAVAAAIGVFLFVAAGVATRIPRGARSAVTAVESV